MREKFNSISPFMQAILIFTIGVVAFVLLSMLISVIIGVIYPDMPSDNANLQMEAYPIQYMFIHFLPVQIGLLLTPGIVYLWLSKKSSNLIENKGRGFIVWSFLLFIVAFLLLPVVGEINVEITKFIGAYEALSFQKDIADHQLGVLIGPVGSTNFLVAILIIGVITGFAEELIFRRFLFQHMIQNTGKLTLSLISSALIFALLHFNYLQILPLFSFGIVLGMMYYVTGSIWPGVIAHTLNNIINLFWLANDNMPDWVNHIDLKTTIPSTILLMGLLIFYFKKR